MSTYEERKQEWELTGKCACKRVDRVPMFAMANHEMPGEGWDVCAVCGKTFERDSPVRLIHVYERGIFWAIPATCWEVHFHPFYGNNEPVFHGAFETFAEAVECAQNIFDGLTQDQPIAAWVYTAPVVSVELEQEIPA